MNYRRRFPDKPNLMSAAQLPVFDLQGGWIATAKQDGWRCMIEVDENGKIEFLSRVWKPLPISAALKDVVARIGLPKATMLDTEWLARRPGYQGPETLHLITIPWYDGEWLGAQPETDRWALTMALMENIATRTSGLATPPIKLPKWTDKEYTQLFEWSKTDPTTEGIVLKRNNSTLIGDLKSSKDNPTWIKIKWRAGHDGQTIIA